jgi:four helix bundle protein
MSGWNPKKAGLPHRKLRVWTAAKALGLEIYRITERFPSDELYGLRAQLRRASVSVVSNVAEGAGRFLLMARGSFNEIDTHLEFAHELGYLEASSSSRSANTLIRRMRFLQRSS